MSEPPATEARTESASSDRRHRGPDWTLTLAMDCQAPHEPPLPIALQGAAEVTIDRGGERRVVAEGTRVRVVCPDRWMSHRHARLVRTDDGWSLLDCDSKNGTRLNGAPIQEQPVGDGDAIECGGSFFVLRNAEPPPSRDPLASRPETLRTVCPALDRELSILRKVAQANVPVLVLGESGTGKEGVAQAIHALSGRDGPYFAVNCGAIPATLIESELFGTRRGAFTGAEDRAGFFRNAERGTLVLDEIGELPPASQVALLRVLQQKELTPLGTNRSIAVDVRVIAVTNQDLRELIQAGRFRRDLYARLSGYELRLPALRDRREDLGLLVATFIRRHDRGGAPRRLSRDAARALFAYDWPLNIRELEQCISAALAIADEEIGLPHLRPPIQQAGQPSSLKALAADRDVLVATIKQHRGNMAAVARALAISRSQIYRLLRRQAIRHRDLTLKS